MTHASEDDLELSSMNRADEGTTATVEQHLLVCEHCRDRLHESDTFIGALRGGAEHLDVLIAEHATDDGLIRVFVRRVSRTFWYARVTGKELDHGMRAPSRSAAESDAPLSRKGVKSTFVIIRVQSFAGETLVLRNVTISGVRTAIELLA